MPTPPLPTNEQERLANLKSYLVLDTPPERGFDSIIEFAAKFFKVPIALISLVDKDRQWFKSCVGLDVTETSRDIAFCAYAILQDEIFVVEDATLDQRFAENPLVTGAPYIRFYGGVPLKTQEGYNIGTLCLIDTKPRQLSNEEKDKLRHLGELVTTRLQLRLATLKLKETNAKFHKNKQVAE